ncbi:MAG: alpha-xylosidase [bacterium]
MKKKRKFLYQYLHYPRKEEGRIFDPEVREYDYAAALLSWKRSGSTVNLRCRTVNGEEFPAAIGFCGDKIFRFRAGRDSLPEGRTAMIIKEEWEEVPIEVVEDPKSLVIQTSSLRVRIDRDPWCIQISDSSGRTVCREHTDGLHKPFFPVYPLGFCAGPSGDVSVYESMDLAPEEHIYGLGEKFSPLNKRGLKIVSWNVDTTLTTTDRSYKNIPFFITTRGYGIFVNSSRKIVYEMGSESFVSYTFEVKDTSLDYFFIYGPKFSDIIYRYTEITGRSPVPPLWSFGLWMSRFGYRNRGELEEVCGKLRENEIPCDVVHLDPYWMRKGHWCDLEWDTRAFPEPWEMLAKLREKGFKVSLWEQPYVPKGTEMFREGDERGYFMKNSKGETYTIIDFEEKPVGIVDFSNPGAVEWYKEKHRKLLEMGVGTFKTDMSEAVPEDGVFAGATGAEMHNLYSLLYNKTVYEAGRDFSPENALVWGRAGYAGTQRYPVTWSGDSHTTFRDMACILRAGLSYGLSGVPFWGHDIGGFQGPPPEPTLYIRWAQFGLLSSHSRCHGIHPREPWEFGERALKIFRKYAELRYRLLPYIYAYAHIASETGLPVVRPLVLEYQDDPTTWDIDLEYLLGRELLIAPIFDESGERTIYLPEGRWTDYWKGMEYRGPQHIYYEAPLEIIPIFVREDSILPMAPKMQFVGEKSWNPLELDIYLKRRAQFTIYEGNQRFRFEASRKPDVIVLKISPSRKIYDVHIHGDCSPTEVWCNDRPISQISGRQWGEVEEGWQADRRAKLVSLKAKAEGKALTFTIKLA